MTLASPNTEAVFFEPLNIRFDPTNFAKKLIGNPVIQTRINRALFVTKVLRMQKIRKGEEAEKLVPSSNLFNLFELTPGALVTEEVIDDGKGMVIRLATSNDTQTKKIYSRRYKDRAEVETMMDIRHQTKIQRAFAGAKKVHLLIEHGKVTITPMLENNVEAESLSIAFDGNDKNALHQIAAKMICVITERKFGSVAVEFKGKGSKALFDILDLQLRRQGYTTFVDDYNINAVHPNEHKTLSPVSLKDFDGYQKLTPNFDATNALSSFVACTGGVDAHLMELEGFTVNNLMDFCPTESRDWKATKRIDAEGNAIRKLTDKTESCLINALANTFRADKVALFNEDFFLADLKRIAALSRPFNFLHFSPCCQDFTLLKSKKERERASQNLTASRDMFVPGLSLINQTQAPAIMFENVLPFGNSMEVGILKAGLAQMGYKLHEEKIKASGQNCFTNRDRYYLFATLLNEGFDFPQAQERTVNVWDDVIKHHLMGPFQLKDGHWANEYVRDVSHTKAVKNAITHNRDRFITEGDHISPAIPRCQSRQVKDAVYIKHGGMYFYPRVKLQRDLMSIPDSFDLSLVIDDVSSEIIGNSVESPQHTAILKKIRTHLLKGIQKLVPRRNMAQVAFSF